MKVTKKSPLVAGRFRAGSFKAKLYETLKDGKVREINELAKVLKGCNSIRGRLRAIEQKGVELKRVEDKVQYLRLKPLKKAA